MPDPSNYDNEDDWMAACVPTAMDEGREQDQAVAMCLDMWRNRNKAVPPSVDRAWSVLTVKSIDTEQRTIEGMASTPSVDRVGDIVRSEGAKFALPLPLLHHHRHDQPVGQVIAAKSTKTGISIKAQFAKVLEPGPLKDRIDTAWQEVKAGLVRGLSIGFKPLEYEMLSDGTGFDFKSWSWYELSLVTIPAQAEASITMVKSCDIDPMAASGRSATRPGASGKTLTNPPVKLKERAMSNETVGERIGALEAKRAANLARMNTMSDEVGKKGETLDESQADEYDGLEREIETIDKHLERERKLEKFNLSKAVAVSQVKTVDEGAAVRSNGDTSYIRVRAPQLPPGIRFARVAKCKALARLDGVDIVRLAENMYGDDQPVVNIIKAAVGAGNTIDPGWAGNLVSDEGAVFADFLEFLRPMTIVGKFGAGNIPGLRRIPFRVPVGSQTSGGAGYWVGEGQAKPLTKFDFAKVVLEPLKVANICVVTEELLRYAAIAAETLLRDQLAAALTARIDTDFIDPAKTAVPNISPASITNGVTPIASSGVDADAVRADVASLIDAFIAASNPAAGATWIMSAGTALRLSMMYNPLGQQEFNGISVNGGTFAGYPVIVSEYVTTSGGSPNTRYVWLVDTRSIFFADEGGINVDMSREASLQMDNAPTMASTELGSPSAPTPTTSVSLWQTNSVGFRAERTLNWSKARPEAVQGLSGVVWGT